MEATQPFRRNFYKSLGHELHLAELFDHLPELYLFAKDKHGRFVKCNRAWLELRGFQDESQVIGKTDFDFHPRYLAERYVAEDRRVMKSRQALPNQAWLVPGEGGKLKWYLSTKTPLFGADGKVVGIAGVLRDLEKYEAVYRPYQAFDEVLRYVLKHFADPIEVGELAAMVDLSIAQFDRRFKALFQITPSQYILRVRVNAACQALATTDQSVGDIALRCGFYDQSYFTKQFRKAIGATPLAYRRQNRRR